MKYRILVINPGSTSTKVACFDNEDCIWEKSLSHHMAELEKFPRVWDQYNFRKELILKELARNILARYEKVSTWEFSFQCSIFSLQRYS